MRPAKFRAMLIIFHLKWARKCIGKIIPHAAKSTAREAGFRSLEINATFLWQARARGDRRRKAWSSVRGWIMIEFYRIRKDLVSCRREWR
jgi:hypothetical protein